MSSVLVLAQAPFKPSFREPTESSVAERSKERPMVNDTGTGSRKGATSGRYQVTFPVTGDCVERVKDLPQRTRGKLMDLRKHVTNFKAVSVAADARRTQA
jgi:hypothetical protein